QWWTFAGGRANAPLAHGLAGVLGCRVAWDNFAVRVEGELRADRLEDAIGDLRATDPGNLAPGVDEGALEGLKFAECLPPEQAAGGVGARLAAPDAVAEVLRQPLRVVFEG